LLICKKKQLEETEQRPQQPQQPQGPPKQSSSGSSSRTILESIEREEDKEARILAEAMTSVPEDEEEEDHEPIQEEEDIQSFSSAERRSKNKRKNEVRYISLKPFFKNVKKERKRQHKMVNWPENDQAELESNGGAAAQEDFDNDENEEDFVKASPVPLPDASSCKSILHRFGYNNESGTNQKKNLRYADGVLPGSGSPDLRATSQEVSVSPPQANLAANSRKRRKKIQVRIIETKHPEESSSDSEDEQVPPPPPPPGSPKLYQTAEFVAKFASKELQVAS